jgi:hypothetical protein
VTATPTAITANNSNRSAIAMKRSLMVFLSCAAPRFRRFAHSPSSLVCAFCLFCVEKSEDVRIRTSVFQRHINCQRKPPRGRTERARPWPFVFSAPSSITPPFAAEGRKREQRARHSALFTALFFSTSVWVSECLRRQRRTFLQVWSQFWGVSVYLPRFEKLPASSGDAPWSHRLFSSGSLDIHGPSVR